MAEKTVYTSTMERAMTLINNYCCEEFGSEASFDKLDSVGIGYTTVTDIELPIQAIANLKENRIERYLLETLIEVRQYDSLEALCDNELESLDFGDLSSVSGDELALIASELTEDELNLLNLRGGAA